MCELSIQRVFNYRLNRPSLVKTLHQRLVKLFVLTLAGHVDIIFFYMTFIFYY